MISFDDALKICLEATPISQSTTVPIEHALGHVLADTVHANLTQPPFNASAMDGYAVDSQTIAVDVAYTQEFEVAAGDQGNQILSNGVARIFTGAPLPSNADAVIIQENASKTDEGVSFSTKPLAGANVRSKGRDFSYGQPLVQAGTKLTAAHIGLIASANVPSVSIFLKPKVGHLSTGDELAAPGSTLLVGQIVGSNAFLLEALLQPHSSKIQNFGTIPDDVEKLKFGLLAALESDIDFLVTTGGASVGDHDLLVPTLRELGAKQLFWKIAMRPGKPVMVSKYKNKLIFTLPGNPVSAFVTATTLVLPTLAAFAGGASNLLNLQTAILDADLTQTGPRRHFRRANISNISGNIHITPIVETDSAHQSSLAQANALLVQFENESAVTSGEKVKYLPL